MIQLLPLHISVFAAAGNPCRSDAGGSACRRWKIAPAPVPARPYLANAPFPATFRDGAAVTGFIWQTRI